ncbi:hypothetical protein HPB48_024974 [Haemaphysalis longicornis]|uniref:Neurotransmitter-gated ion-channel ligand-binding domain-containing protein n=1 Tax=Haemaphysalis longicornis TaxID=44386 RepID=A0A9J6H8Z6_HAELO|nr:hypothetical protein HPB48_024974 [Haemaphysalis longicornis]
MPRHTEAVQPSMRVRGQATTPAAPGQTPQGRRGPNPSRWLFARVKGVILASRQTPWVSSLGVFLASTLPLIPFTFERVSSPSAPSVYLGLRFLLFFLDVCLFVSRLFELSVHDFTSDFYFRQSWRDERLSFQKSPDLESMTVGAEVAEKIWVPDTFFANEKSAYFHAATTPNTFLRIGSGGEVFRSIRTPLRGFHFLPQQAHRAITRLLMRGVSLEKKKNAAEGR